MQSQGIHDCFFESLYDTVPEVSMLANAIIVTKNTMQIIGEGVTARAF